MKKDNNKQKNKTNKLVEENLWGVSDTGKTLLNLCGVEKKVILKRNTKHIF